MELASELLDISWGATPNDAKQDTLWSDFSGTTYLWMPPSHGISQMTISLEGVIPQSVTEEFREFTRRLSQQEERSISLHQDSKMKYKNYLKEKHEDE